jgi:hypothetical protein
VKGTPQAVAQTQDGDRPKIGCTFGLGILCNRCNFAYRQLMWPSATLLRMSKESAKTLKDPIRHFAKVFQANPIKAFGCAAPFPLHFSSQVSWGHVDG